MTTARRATPSQFSFASGTLTLDDVPLAKAIADLDRWYDVDIRLSDSALAAKEVGGVFAAGSLSDVSGILEVGLNVLRVVRNGRVLTLLPR